MSVIQLSNLTKYYGKARGIKNISFSVEHGEIFGFIGPNGAGKSTTIRTLLSLLRPSSGNATIFGKDCIRFSKEIAKDVGYVPSEVFYYDNMKVHDLLNYSASFYKKDCREKIKHLCDTFEVETHKKIDDLSFGNRKKVGIVQALLHNPKLLILDEPTSGLDPIMQQKFFDIIREENKNGATVLFSSHILSEVQKLCHRVAIIKEGQIVSLETMDSLKDNGYKKIYIETNAPIDREYLKDAGIAKLVFKETSASFIYKGNVHEIVRKLSRLPIKDINIEDPNLEEIFMHYYS